MNQKISFCLRDSRGYYHVRFRVKTLSGETKEKTYSTGIKVDESNAKKRALEKGEEIVALFEGTVYNERSEMSLSAYMLDWIDRNLDIQPTTHMGYMHMMERHIAEHFSSIKLRDVRPFHIQEYMKKKIAGGLSPNTVIKHVSLIQTVLKDAYCNELIKTNPAEKVKRPKRKKPKHGFYTPEQLKDLFYAVEGTKMELPVMLAVFFGLRRSEALGMSWSNIDLEKKTLTVAQKVTRQMINGKLTDVVSDQLKTDSSYDTYYLNEAMCEYFKKQKAKQERHGVLGEFVCIDGQGKVLKIDYITDKFSKILNEHNLPHIRFHDLRHSCLTLLANNPNFSMKQVQDYARHANFSITADTYSHVFDTNKLIELNAICDSLDMNGDL